MLSFEVQEMRKGGGTALAFFTLAIGTTASDGTFVGELMVRDVVVKRAKDDTLWYQLPQKARMDKATGEQAVNDQGYKVYDDQVSAYGDKSTGTWKPTSAAFGFRKAVIAEITRQFNTLGDAPARPATPRPAGLATSIAPQAGGFGGGDDDIDLPY